MKLILALLAAVIVILGAACYVVAYAQELAHDIRGRA